MKFSIISFGFLILLQLFIARNLLLKIPPIWPDEAIYADVTFQLKNKQQTNLLDSVPKWNTMLTVSQKVFLFILTIWFLIFSDSIVSQRVLSVIVSLFFLIFFYQVVRIFTFKKHNILIPILVLAALEVDYNFQYASRISRPEIFVTTIGFAAIYFFLKSSYESKLGYISFPMLLSGLLTGLAFLIHPAGLMFFASLLIYIFICYRLITIKKNIIYLFIFFFLIPLIILIISNLSYLSEFKEVMHLAVQRRNLAGSAIVWAINYLFTIQSVQKQIIHFGYLLTMILFLFFTLFHKKQFLLISISLLFLSFFSLYGRTYWYFFNVVPFIYLAFAVLLSYLNFKQVLFKLILSIFIINMVLNIDLLIQDIMITRSNNYSYEIYFDQIIKSIHEEKSVFLSAIPDPYYGFKIKNRRNRLYEFPSLPISEKNYFEVLDAVDYIVYTGSYEGFQFKYLLINYITKNQSQILSIGENNQFKAAVIKLTSKDIRVH